MKPRGPRQSPVKAPHGHARKGKRTPTFYSWAAMRERCTNKNHQRYPYYGGRGIRVCERWLHSFTNFLADMGERPPGTTLDRIDSDGDYCKENCRWRTRVGQCRNKRSNITVEYQGRSMCLTEACDLAGADYMLVRKRLKKGWSLKDAMTLPVRIGGGKRRGGPL